MKSIVLVSGWAGAGKDTFARFMKEFAPDKVEIMRFAEPIKEWLAIIEGVPREWMDDPVKKLPYREKMQRMGTEVFRDQIDKQFWVRWLMGRALECEKSIVVVPDARFKNEIDPFFDDKRFLPFPVRIERDGHKAVNEHLSEHDLDDYEHFLHKLFIPENGLCYLHGAAVSLVQFIGHLRSAA